MGVYNRKPMRKKHGRFSIHWVALLTLPCVSSFLLYLCLFYLPFLNPDASLQAQMNKPGKPGWCRPNVGNSVLEVSALFSSTVPCFIAPWIYQSLPWADFGKYAHAPRPGGSALIDKATSSNWKGDQELWWCCEAVLRDGRDGKPGQHPARASGKRAWALGKEVLRRFADSSKSGHLPIWPIIRPICRVCGYLWVYGQMKMPSDFLVSRTMNRYILKITYYKGTWSYLRWRPVNLTNFHLWESWLCPLTPFSASKPEFLLTLKQNPFWHNTHFPLYTSGLGNSTGELRSLNFLYYCQNMIRRRKW